MEDKKQYCENLFNKYVELSDKLGAQKVDTKNGVIPTPDDKTNELKKDDLCGKLKNCLNELLNEQLEVIKDCPELAEAAEKVIVERGNKK